MKLLPKGWYSATITQARFEEINGHDRVVIVYTIDSGEYAWRNILVSYPNNERGLKKLFNDMEEMNYIVYLGKGDYFTQQFTEPPKRAMIHVDRYVSDREGVVKNIILERKINKTKPEYDVLKEKSEEHFHENNKGRKLPL